MPSEHPPDTFHTPSLHLPNTFQTLSWHPPDTLCTLTRHQPNISFLGYIENNFQLGRWVGGSCCRIMPLRGPTCKFARFQAELKFPSWTEFGNILIGEVIENCRTCFNWGKLDTLLRLLLTSKMITNEDQKVSNFLNRRPWKLPVQSNIDSKLEARLLVN